MDPTILDNFLPVSNLPLLGKMVEKLIWLQFQRTLEEADYFRIGFGIEAVFITFLNDLGQR